MSRTLRLKRGTAVQNDAFVGDQGEVTFDVTNKTLRIHDGVTMGGISTVKLTDVSSALATAFMDHSISSDHDDLYYRKEAVDSLIAAVETGSVDFDAQNTDLLVDGLTYGWRDIVNEIRVRGTGVNNPSWSVFRNGIYAFAFEASKTMEFWASFHIDHDYAMGTKIFPHVHWSPNTTATGTVRWGFEYTVAKGHQQGPDSVFGPPSVVYAETNIAQPSQYMHFVTEVSEAQAIPATLLEPDTLINIRFFRDGGNDTFPNSVYAFTADLHYQTARIATKNKAPDFFGAGA